MLIIYEKEEKLVNKRMVMKECYNVGVWGC